MFPLIAGFLTSFLIGCGGGKVDNRDVFISMKDIPESQWQRLSEKTIFFGHHSVGNNIISGLQDLMIENPQIKLNILETHDPAAFNTPLLAHSKVGMNMDPKSKCDAFADFMERGLGEKADIAFFKFCFVDLKAATDIDSLFSDYKKTMEVMRQKYPRTTFLHVTVPLTTVQTGIKAWVKQIIGRPIDGYDDNARRGEFNDRLRNEYQGKAPVFDLAVLESTSPDGTRTSFARDGRVYQSMVPDYTHDGGHLNERGRRLVAEQLLVLLVSLSR